jgi:hypothetical protein
MYSTCLVCNQSLGANDRIEHFPVGRRLAFDADRGRLWVVCGQCAQWNLSPLEERWEAIEECERLYRATLTRVSTDNIGMARIGDDLTLVRIGNPLRPEFAAWRYGQRLSRRRRRFHVVAGAALAATTVAGVALGPLIWPILAPAFALGTISIIVVPGVTSALGVIPVVGVLAARDYIQHDRVVARLSDGTKAVTVRAKHVEAAQLEIDAESGTAKLALPHDSGWSEFSDAAAIQATGLIISGANRFGAARGHVQDAVRQIEGEGDANGFLAAASRRNGWRGSRMTSVLNAYRGFGALHLSGTERLALEMAVHEEHERRVLEGELSLLEAAWRSAEEIAAISDVELSPPRLYE